MDTIITKTWDIYIDENEVFSRCSNESLYQAYARTADNPKGDAIVMQEDDNGVFQVYFAAALSNLRMLLARRMEGMPVPSASGITFTLNMHDNHDDNIQPILINHCYDYLVKQILERWYGTNLGSELEKLEINHCLHYRKNPVRRRVRPMF